MPFPNIKDNEPYGSDLVSTIDDKERETLFYTFGEGDPNLTKFLKTAYEHGAPSMFCCSGHGVNNPYVVLKVTDENIDLLVNNAGFGLFGE